LFVAIPLPESIKDEIEKAQTELRRGLAEDCVRWTKRAQFHLTLKFLGDVEAERVADLKNVVSNACEKFPAMQLRAERIGFFPQARSPRVVWVGVNDPAGTLPQLQNAVDAALKEYSREKPEGIFTGHVTLGRVKMIKRPQADLLAKLALDMATRRFGEWTADKVELIRSELASDGARYTTLAAVDLGRAGLSSARRTAR
jgi:2'-5' RNA ligase